MSLSLIAVDGQPLDTQEATLYKGFLNASLSALAEDGRNLEERDQEVFRSSLAAEVFELADAMIREMRERSKPKATEMPTYRMVDDEARICAWIDDPKLYTPAQNLAIGTLLDRGMLRAALTLREIAALTGVGTEPLAGLVRAGVLVRVEVPDAS